MKKIFILVFGIFLVSLVGCGNSKKDLSTSTSMIKQEDFAGEIETVEENTLQEKVNQVSNKEEIERKLIKTVTLNIETKEFDNLIKEVEEKTEELEGYIEESSIDGESFTISVLKRATIICRIPKEKLDLFIDSIGNLGNIVNQNSVSEDITLSYIDTESKVKSLKIEQKRLMTLLEKADKLSAIIELENRLTEVRTQLESYASQIRLYDNQVNYSTITLNIKEVEHISPVTEKKNMWQEIKNGFLESVYRISNGLKNLVIWFLSNILYLLIWAFFFFVLIRLLKRYLKKRKETLNKQKNVIEEIQKAEIKE